MTWSFKQNLIRTEPPHVLWNGEFLRQLPDDDFKKAIRAAEAFGDDTLNTVGTSDHPGQLTIDQATAVVGAVIKEMGKRGWSSTAGEAERDNQ